MNRDEDKYLWGDGEVTVVLYEDAAKRAEPKVRESVAPSAEEQPNEEDE